ncbi:MAG: hypothetical protein U0894_08665 [Pirellulales bacterium]
MEASGPSTCHPKDSGDPHLAEAFPSRPLPSSAEPVLALPLAPEMAAREVLLLDDLASLTLSVFRAHQLLGNTLTQLASKHGLTTSELLVVWLCTREAESLPDRNGDAARESGWVQNDIAAALAFSPAQTSSVVDKLQQRGLLSIARSQNERRRQICQTTLQGQQLLAQLCAEWEVASHTSLATGIEKQLAKALSHLRPSFAALQADGSPEISRPSAQRGAA